MRKKLLLILAVVFVLSFSACTEKTDNNQPQEQIETTESEVESTARPETEELGIDENYIAPIGITANHIRIENEIEGFFIEIPDSWLGRVSYDVIDGEIIIYHITQDSSQPSHYPMVVTIGASYKSNPVEMYPSAEVFMELDYVEFYSMSPMDVPYNMDSSDMQEYEMLLVDVPQVLQTVWVLDEPESDETLLLDEEPEMLSASPFTIMDTTLNNVYLGYSKDAVLEMLGNDFVLNDIKLETWDATGEEVEIYQYDSFDLTFIDGIFKIADVRTPMLFGPRGFSIGNNLNEIVEVFADSAEYINGNETVFYRGNGGDDNKDMYIAPYCILYENEKKLEMVCFENENLIDEVEMEELKGFHMYEVHYSCSFFFDENDVVESFRLFYGPLVE